jgi:hypothetical protein
MHVGPAFAPVTSGAFSTLGAMHVTHGRAPGQHAAFGSAGSKTPPFPFHAAQVAVFAGVEQTTSVHPSAATGPPSAAAVLGVELLEQAVPTQVAPSAQTPRKEKRRSKLIAPWSHRLLGATTPR